MPALRTLLTRRRFVIPAVWLIGLYAGLLIASHLIDPGPRHRRLEPSVAVPAFTQEGVDEEFGPVHIHYERRPAETRPLGGSGRPPVLLIHGTPGTHEQFISLVTPLARAGYETISVDLPGFGGSTRHAPDIGILAHAKMLEAFLDELGVERAHVVGFSLGGGVGLHLCELAPRRVASLTLLSSIGIQATEGSGSFHLEHARYALGFAGLWSLQNLVPHFGTIYRAEPMSAGVSGLRASMVNLFDSDQRPLRSVMGSLRTPTLIIHGRQDPLVMHWAAERHHALIPTSSLVMTPHSHFMLFRYPSAITGPLLPFLDRHDETGVPPRTAYVNNAPVTDRGLLGELLDWFTAVPWWFKLALVVLGARAMPETTTVLAGLGRATMSLDFGLAAFGIVLGRVLTPSPRWEPHPVWRRVLAPPWTLAALLASVAALAWIESGVLEPLGLALTLPIAVPLVVAMTLLLRAARHVVSANGMRMIVAALRAWTHHEWWNAIVIYTPLIPWLFVQGLRTRHMLAFSAVNPGIPAGGGMFGESKAQILDALAGAPAGFVLPHATISNTRPADDRFRESLGHLRARPELGGLPIVAKPSAGERGSGVRLICGEGDLRAFFEATPAEAILQRFHPGPHECGIMWVRDPEHVDRDPPPGQRVGRIFMINRKRFPETRGDGRSTLRELIWRDRRLRLQREVFFERHAERLDEVVPEGETVRLGQAGNHAQGCRLTDGRDLITPELEDAVDAVARSFRGVGGRGFDLGRFDVRYESDEKLRAGTGLAIVELNGVTSEPTSMYDPDWSPLDAYRLLYRQWSLLYTLGARRIRAGDPPITWRTLVGYAVGAINRERASSD